LFDYGIGPTSLNEKPRADRCNSDHHRSRPGEIKEIKRCAQSRTSPAVMLAYGQAEWDCGEERQQEPNERIVAHTLYTVATMSANGSLLVT